MKKLMVSVALAAAVLTCGHPVEKAKSAVRRVTNPGEADVPIGTPDSVPAREQQRYDLRGRLFQSFHKQQQQQARKAQQPGTEPAPPQPIQFVSGVKESF